ncbi:MAG TPA: carboxypeptidase-like regulatory domain-containing protein, partial [Caldithrix sp.]|nr:carboxypeptidase-like regulatory domain-containing protein [Caldithrix sp.]
MTKKVFILLLCLLPFTGLFAGTSGKITGVVKDKENKEALIGVNIQILGLPLGGASDVDGFYFINNVPPGTYTLKATYLGYRPVEIKNVQVTVDHTTEISIEMEPASIEFEETITVVAERPLIQKDATSKRAVIDGSQIADILPVSTVREALAMQAGVVKDED